VSSTEQHDPTDDGANDGAIDGANDGLNASDTTPLPEHTVIGVDIGGTGIKAAPVDLATGSLIRERIRELTPHPATPDAVAEVVAEIVGRIGGSGPLGVTLPAVVQHGIARSAANIDAGWIDLDADALLSRVTGRSVGVVNDADAAGVAEMRFGAGRDQQGVTVMITLGTGIGSALFVDGVLVPNTEFGHLHLHGGDAEDYAAELVREREDLSWKAWAHRIEKYVHLLERLLSPDLIIIGGGVSKKSEKFLPHIDCRTPIVPAAMHNDAGIVGAALFAPAD
jgi:polyphosphate glucokinase